MKRAHNHPPDTDMEERNAFIDELKMLVQVTKSDKLKEIYDTIALRY